MAGQRTQTTTTLEIEGLVVELTRKNVRNINLRIRNDGTVCVSAGPRVPLRQIEAFVSSKREWIEQARSKLATRTQDAQQHCSEGATVRIWGRALTCRITSVNGTQKQPSCSFAYDEKHLYVQADSRIADDSEHSVAARDDSLDQYLREALKNEATSLLPRLQKLVGKQCTQLRYRRMTSRWGSCNVQTGAITLNTELIHYQKRCLEYVIIHELCHLHEPSHDDHFHALMDQFYPDWRSVRSELNGRT